MLDTLRSIDHNIFYWLNGNLVNHYTWLDNLLKLLSVYLIYAIPVVLVISWFFFKSDKNHRLMLNSFLAGVVAWQGLARLIGEIYFRARPFSHLSETKELVFHLPTYSFPSDHAAFLAALTTYFYLAGYKKVGHWALALTLFVSFTRVITGLHWPADIIAGWIVGVLVALIFWKAHKWLDRWVINPLLFIAKKIKVA